jgi:hypothetical protein
MKPCSCGHRLTAYSTRTAGVQRVRYLKCRSCGKRDREYVRVDGNGREILLTNVLAVSKQQIVCPCCAVTIKL